MSQKTKIQWCDSTVNPTMGCSGCELFPSPFEVFRNVDAAVLPDVIDSRELLKNLIHEVYQKIPDPGAGHRDSVTMTNLWHFREPLCQAITDQCCRKAGRAALAATKQAMKCYAATLHLNRGANILKPDRTAKKGYAPTFEQVTNFDGRMAKAARYKDLLGSTNPKTPWKDGLARMLFISDMGDALCSASQRQFDYLRSEVLDAVTSENGCRHLWLWLTKRPKHMSAFADQIGGFPANLIAMTTVTSPATLHRADALRQVAAPCRGLSVEPLWERLPAADLDLRGIDWLILGGESGSRTLAQPFHLEWAVELHAHCRKHGVAFFLKQLGRNPVAAGKPIRLRNSHGGDWSEWPSHLRVREFPEYFHRYRADEHDLTQILRPA